MRQGDAHDISSPAEVQGFCISQHRKKEIHDRSRNGNGRGRRAPALAGERAHALKRAGRSSVGTIIAASMVGTTIEFYDFYAYGTAAANCFPRVFFSDKTNPTVALLLSLVTFAVAL